MLFFPASEDNCPKVPMQLSEVFSHYAATSQTAGESNVELISEYYITF